MLGTLYSHTVEDGRFLFVRRDRPFPLKEYDTKEWRLIAIGVEPMSTAVAETSRLEGFADYRMAIPEQ